MSFFVFFKQKTAYDMRISDWSSDVCSSDLPDLVERLAHREDRTAGRLGGGGDTRELVRSRAELGRPRAHVVREEDRPAVAAAGFLDERQRRTEERRGGEEGCRTG